MTSSNITLTKQIKNMKFFQLNSTRADKGGGDDYDDEHAREN